MPQPFTVTGGARIGWMNASWPLAKLSADSDKLSISVRLLGNYCFEPDQVLSIERYVMIPFFGWGVQIHHHVADYPQRIIFWSLGNPDKVIQGIRDSGFLPAASGSAVPQRCGIALRWSAIVFFVAVWNGLFLLAFFYKMPPQPGVFTLVPLLFAFSLCIGVLKYPKLQRLFLKPDRSVGEIRPFLRFLAFISGILLVIFAVLIACNALA